ncbi:MAG: hypothetical protein OEZ06_25755 [Myxococcales bacterium]|nr:hypothetical protein [Myxococcales bacterium]
MSQVADEQQQPQVHAGPGGTVLAALPLWLGALGALPAHLPLTSAPALRTALGTGALGHAGFVGQGVLQLCWVLPLGPLPLRVAALELLLVSVALGLLYHALRRALLAAGTETLAATGLAMGAAWVAGQSGALVQPGGVGAGAALLLAAVSVERLLALGQAQGSAGARGELGLLLALSLLAVEAPLAAVALAACRLATGCGPALPRGAWLGGLATALAATAWRLTADLNAEPMLPDAFFQPDEMLPGRFPGAESAPAMLPGRFFEIAVLPIARLGLLGALISGLLLGLLVRPWRGRLLPWFSPGLAGAAVLSGLVPAALSARLLPAPLALALLCLGALGCGGCVLGWLLAERRGPWLGRAVALPLLLLGVALLQTRLAAAVGDGAGADPSAAADAIAEAELRSLPSRSAVLIGRAAATRLRLLQRVEGSRPDVTLLPQAALGDVESATAMSRADASLAPLIRSRLLEGSLSAFALQTLAATRPLMLEASVLDQPDLAHTLLPSGSYLAVETSAVTAGDVAASARGQAEAFEQLEALLSLPALDESTRRYLAAHQLQDALYYLGCGRRVAARQALQRGLLLRPRAPMLGHLHAELERAGDDGALELERWLKTAPRRD